MKNLRSGETSLAMPQPSNKGTAGVSFKDPILISKRLSSSNSPFSSGPPSHVNGFLVAGLHTRVMQTKPTKLPSQGS